MLSFQQVIIFSITKNVGEGNVLVVVYRIIPSARKITIHVENNSALSRGSTIGEGRDTTISSPGRSPNSSFRG